MAGLLTGSSLVPFLGVTSLLGRGTDAAWCNEDQVTTGLACEDDDVKKKCVPKGVQLECKPLQNFIYCLCDTGTLGRHFCWYTIVPDLEDCDYLNEMLPCAKDFDQETMRDSPDCAWAALQPHVGSLDTWADMIAERLNNYDWNNKTCGNPQGLENTASAKDLYDWFRPFALKLRDNWKEDYETANNGTRCPPPPSTTTAKAKTTKKGSKKTDSTDSGGSAKKIISLRIPNWKAILLCCLLLKRP